MSTFNAGQRFLETCLPRGLFEALEAGTRTFMLVCPCGEMRDLWEAGGAKGGGTQQKTLSRCSGCHERTWHLKRKKTSEEQRESLLNATRDVVMLSSHSIIGSVLAWGSAALIWSLPLFTAAVVTEPLHVVGVWLVSFTVGWFGPYLWATTRYRVGRTELDLLSGIARRTLELRRIQQVSRTRKGVGLSFAFDTDTLWIGYPSAAGGYLVSPRERDLFLELLDQRCAHLELRGGELLPVA